MTKQASTTTAKYSDEKKKSAQEALDRITKQFGKGTAMKFSDAPLSEIKGLSTGSLGIDITSGVGGFAQGRIIECISQESCGKTTVALQAIARAQQQGHMCAFIDAEHALDPTYARNLGVDMDNLVISQPDYGEQALEVAEELVSSGAFAIVAVDSIAALTPKAEIEGDFGDAQMGAQARMISQAMRKLVATVGKTNTTLILLNQYRSKIGVIFGSPLVAAGGNSIKFYASQRIEYSKIGNIKDGDNVIGSRIRAKFIKNKTAPPFRQCEYDILFGQGVNYDGELLDYCITLQFVEKNGAWYSYNGEKMGQGKENSVQYLKDHPEVRNVLDAQVRKHYNLESK